MNKSAAELGSSEVFNALFHRRTESQSKLPLTFHFAFLSEANTCAHTHKVWERWNRERQTDLPAFLIFSSWRSKALTSAVSSANACLVMAKPCCLACGKKVHILSKTSFILLSKDLVQTLEMDVEINLWRQKGHCSNSGPTVTTTLRWVDKVAPQPLPIGIGSTHNCFTLARTASRHGTQQQLRYFVSMLSL